MNSELFFFTPEWPISYLDNHILALYKPAGLLVQGDKTGRISLVDLVRLWIKQKFSKPGNVYVGLVHRLDFHVAGVMIFARTSKAASRLSQQFRNKQVIKEYLAVVEGRPKKRKDKLIHRLTRTKNKTLANPCVSTSTEKKRDNLAILTYEVIKTTGSVSLLKVIPITGKKHQIRAQLASIGHPIVGDRLYGAGKSTGSDEVISLLSKQITFIHPTKQEQITLESPLPFEWPLRSETDTSRGVLWRFTDFDLSHIHQIDHG